MDRASGNPDNVRHLRWNVRQPVIVVSHFHDVAIRPQQERMLRARA